MKQRITSAEFTELMAYNNLSPGGYERFDTLTALLCCTVGNMLKGKGKPFSIKDFVIDWGKKVTKADWRDIKIKMTQFATRHNKKVKRETDKDKKK